jgi:hypothetical protein
VLFGKDGVTIWDPRPLPKIVQDLMKPVLKSVPAEPNAVTQESLLGFLPPLLPTETTAATARTNNKNQSPAVATEPDAEVATAASANNHNKTQNNNITIQPLTIVVDAASSSSHNKKRSKVAIATSTKTNNKNQTPLVANETESVSEAMSAKDNEVGAIATSTKNNNKNQRPLVANRSSG